MCSEIPEGTDKLCTLISSGISKSRFQSSLRRLQALFDIYISTCPVPLPAPGLMVTPEIRAQCERYLPIADIAAAFNHLYSAALTYPPILSSTPFHNALSWADCYASLPEQFQFSANPALLLESLLADSRLMTRFLFASFLPGRFYGGIGRYSGQQRFIREWLLPKKTGSLRCLDAACGTGEESYGLALLLLEMGFSSEKIHVDGWTLEPLEVWAAAHRRFPHDRRREALFREETAELFERGFHRHIRFRPIDLTAVPLTPLLSQGEPAGISQFDLILCNGLLGGPIVHEKGRLGRVVGNLSALLSPGGILLAADRFHGGWKQKCPQSELRALFEKNRLETFEAGEGIGGLKPYQ